MGRLRNLGVTAYEIGEVTPGTGEVILEP
jgi:hypothetical protein